MQWMTKRNWLVCSATLALSACGVAESRTDPPPRLEFDLPDIEPAANTADSAPDMAAQTTQNIPPESRAKALVPGGTMLSDAPVSIGKPYSIKGVTYTPADAPDYDEVGYASWYGEELEGQATANGEAFAPAAISAAHRTLPLPSYVEVTSLDNGRTILVRINDRGPFAADRLIDLSRGAAEQLGITGHGHAAVRVRRVNPPQQDKALLRAGRHAAQRMEAPDILLNALRSKLGYTPAEQKSDALQLDYGEIPQGDDSVTASDETALLGDANSYVVQLAAFSSRFRAKSAAKRAGGFLAPSASGTVWRVRLGPYQDLASARDAIDHAAASGFQGARIMVND